MMWAAIIGAVIWVSGWIAMAHTVELEHSDRFWRKVESYAILFFVWPYIALYMMNQGDI